MERSFLINPLNTDNGVYRGSLTLISITGVFWSLSNIYDGASSRISLKVLFYVWQGATFASTQFLSLLVQDLINT